MRFKKCIKIAFLIMVTIGFSVFGQENLKKEQFYFDKFKGECLNKDNLKSCYNYAVVLERNGHKDDAIKEFKRVCNGGNMKGCSKVGEILIADKNPDYFKYYNRACKGGITKACQRIKLEKLFEECKEGVDAQCVKMGNYYQSKNNTKKARQFYLKACKNNNQIACLKANPDKGGSNILLWASIILFGISIFIVTNTMFQDEDQFKAAEKISEAGELKGSNNQGIVLKYSRPFFKRYISPIVSSMKGKKKIREKYKRSLASAGLTNLMTPEDFYSFKLFLIIGFPIVFLGVREFLEETWPLKFVFFISILGYFYPNIWIKGKIGQRQKDLLRSMPFAVDMLALSVEAGLDFVAAMSKVIEKAKPSPLTEEFSILMKETKIGASRAEALRNMAWRVDLMQISSFCATLIAADSVGANIGPILKSLSGEIRQKKSTDAEKAGATAATKILFPMLFLIVPAVFIVVAAPIVLELMGRK